MNIAINLEEIIKYTNFIDIIFELLNNGNKVYFTVNNKSLKNQEILNKLKDIKNINFTDTIFYASSDELTDLLKIKNIGYVIDDDYLTENRSIPVVHMGTNEENKNNLFILNNADEVLKHFNEHKENYEQHIKDPITVMSGIPSIDKIWNRQYTINQMNTSLQNMSVYDYVLLNNKDNMDSVALRYFGSPMTFKEMFDKIDECAKSLKNSGVNEGDIVTICMPNTPEGVIAFFATNKIGAVASMLHPLLKGKDILETLQKTESKYMVMADMCHSEVNKIVDQTKLEKIVVVSPSESMPI